jgi:5-methylcytosine-specific restriction endonuclease McrA
MADHDSITRTCTACATPKPFSEFNKKKGGKHGLQPVCRPCQKATQKVWRDANPDKVKANNSRWYAENRESFLKEKREAYPLIRDAMNESRRAAYRASPSFRDAIYAWREKNEDKFRANYRRYYANNRESVKSRVKDWRSRNPEIVRAMRESWIRRNPDVWRLTLRASGSRRRARMRGADGSFTRRDIDALRRLQRNRCACCKRSISNEFHVDHVMPLFLGGSNRPENLQLLCPGCNLKKSAKHPIDFMRDQGFLL